VVGRSRNLHHTARCLGRGCTFFRRPYYADAAPQGGLDDLTRHSDVTKLACHSLPQKDRAKASLYACYLAINLQNFGGSDVERARRRTSAGFILASRNRRAPDRCGRRR